MNVDAFEEGIRLKDTHNAVRRLKQRRLPLHSERRGYNLGEKRANKAENIELYAMLVRMKCLLFE